MNIHEFPVKRVLAFWLLTFACAYVSNLFLYTIYQITLSWWAFVLLQAATPLCYLLFGWLYFRRAVSNDWAHRIALAMVWIALTLLATAVLMQPVYGYPWTMAFTAGILKGQAINVAAVFVAALVAKK
jgi:hypothetical protein